MGYARVLGAGLVGMAGHVVEVEAHLGCGVPGVVISGLPDTALSQARDRVRAAVSNAGERWPAQRITINLQPASLPKHGSGFDLAVAAAVLCATDALSDVPLRDVVLIGELGLDGQVRPVRGVLPALLAAARDGVRRAIVPVDNAREARLVPELEVSAADTLRRVLDHLRGDKALAELPDEVQPTTGGSVPDLAEVAGQALGRRSLEVAAAGGHNLALFGPPGAGKTMLAERLPTVLPVLDDRAALEVTAVHSVAGELEAGASLIRQPPYQAPHHTASLAALVGGGSGLARPGALSLAHRGVLFLDEAPEFRVGVLDTLRQPLERGEVILARSGGITRYPARVQLVLAANPCPCASQRGDTECVCTPWVRRRYAGRLSGPLLDRIDLQVELMPVGSAALMVDSAGIESSAVVAGRVATARDAAAHRWQRDGWRTNAEVPTATLRRIAGRLPRPVTLPVRAAIDRGLLSARGHDRVLRLAWTLADLAGRERPDQGDVHEAIGLRTRMSP